MGKQKLPEGWAYNAYGIAGEGKCVDVNEERVTLHDILLGRIGAPASVVLAAIRPLDPVYLAAKALFTSDGSGVSVSHEKLLELKALIESLEEP